MIRNGNSLILLQNYYFEKLLKKFEYFRVNKKLKTCLFYIMEEENIKSMF